ncbi:MAG: hypothetical protein AAB385_11445, partial [Planctomycetota bacterium]
MVGVSPVSVVVASMSRTAPSAVPAVTVPPTTMAVVLSPMTLSSPLGPVRVIPPVSVKVSALASLVPVKVTILVVGTVTALVMVSVFPAA